MANKLTKPYKSLSMIIRECLIQDPSLVQKLRNKGLKAKEIDTLTLGTYHDNTLWRIAPVLEKVMNIDIITIVLLETKQKLWHHDKLPQIESYQDLLDALKQARDIHGLSKLNRYCKRSHGAVSRWLSGKRRLDTKSMRLCLQALVNLADKNYKNNEETHVKVVAKRSGRQALNGNSNRRILSAAISSLNSSTTVLECGTSPKEFLDGDRARILGILARILRAAGVNPKVINRLNQGSPLTEADDEILKVLTKS